MSSAMATAERTYGTVGYAAGPRTGTWLVKANSPNVTTWLKRMLPRAKQDRVGRIVVGDAPGAARDLEWLLERYPMQMSFDVRTRLAAQADRHRAVETDVQSILNGYRLPPGERTPAREPFPYQLEHADLATATGRLLITDQVGLGKSFSALLVLRAVGALPALIVTLTHLPHQWIARELAETFPDLVGHVIEGTKPYDITARNGGRAPDVLAISYSKLPGWADFLAGKVKTVIFDEIHELRHEDSDKYRAATMIADAADYKVGLSATPVFNYGGEAYNVIDVLAPGALGERSEFKREWCGSEAGRAIVEDPAALGTWLREQGLMNGYTREDVGRPLPEPILIPQEVDADADVFEELAGDAMEMARFLLDRGNAGKKQRFQVAGQLDMKVRQATGIAKAPFVAAFVRMLLEREQRLVLWGWHRAVYDVWMERLADLNPRLYTGSESNADKAAAVKDFLDGDCRVLIMSLRSGAGLDGLQTGCTTTVFGEMDWSPQVHTQCIGRFNRPGITRAVQAYFCTSTFGSDPAMLELLNLKRMQNDPLVDPRAAKVRPVAPTESHTIALARSIVERGLHAA